MPDPLALSVDDLWRPEVQEKDYEAARNYLSLRLTPSKAERLVARFQLAKLEERRVNDILRAAALQPLPVSDPGVRRNLIKYVRGKKLAPVLIVSFPDRAEIADGYHRVSTVYWLSPDNPARCLVVDG